MYLGLTDTKKLFRTKLHSLFLTQSQLLFHMYTIFISLKVSFICLLIILQMASSTTEPTCFCHSTLCPRLVTISVFYSLNSQWRESDWSRSTVIAKPHQSKVSGQPMGWLLICGRYQVQSAMARRRRGSM